MIHPQLPPFEDSYTQTPPTQPATASWLEVSAQAFEHNVRMYKNVIGNKQLAVVLKSNGYGHGTLQIATLAQQSAYAAWVCVADLQEAVYLRTNGIHMPILLLFINIVSSNLEDLATHNIDVIVYHQTHLDLLNAIGKKLKKKINVHIKIDTGMARFGVAPHEAVDLVIYARTLSWIVANGLCSHLAESAAQDTAYTEMQLNTFDAIVDELAMRNITIAHLHAANSAGALLQPDAHRGNLFRIGIGVYGLWSSAEYQTRIQAQLPNFTLQPVLTWKTSIIELKKIPAGSYVGYDRTYQATHDTIVALLPVGYFEGYERRLSNNPHLVVQVGNSFAPVIGRICMNVTIVDVTNVPDAHIGQTVTLLSAEKRISAETLAELSGSFNPREIICRINPALDRLVV